MTDTAAWASVLVGVAVLVVGYVRYRGLHRKTRLEYVVVSNARVVPSQLSAKLDVTYAAAKVPDASVAIIRVVNTGEKAILAEHFSSPLRIRLDGATEVVAALATKTRPPALNPSLSLDKNSVLIAPLLLNRGDLIQLQLLSSGLPSGITIEGRVAEVPTINQRNMPYPPGSGPEGELLGMDKFVWYVLLPICGGALLIYLFSQTRWTPIPKAIAIVGVLVVGLVIIPMYVRFLVRRRELWRP